MGEDRRSQFTWCALSPKTTLAKVNPAVEAELENCGKLGTVASGSCLESVPLWLPTGDA